MIGNTIDEILDHYDTVRTSYLEVAADGLVLDGCFPLSELEDIVKAYKRLLENAK